MEYRQHHNIDNNKVKNRGILTIIKNWWYLWSYTKDLVNFKGKANTNREHLLSQKSIKIQNKDAQEQ